MKVSLLALALILNTIVFAQSKEEKEIAETVEKLRTAMVSADKAQLSGLAHEELSYGHSSGKVEDKASFVQSLLSGQSDFVEITLSEQEIKVAGSTAIVRHKLFAKTNDAGKEPGTVKLAILLVWHKQNGKWKLLARQAVKI